MLMPPPIVPAPMTAARLNLDDRRVRGETGNPGRSAFGEEEVTQCPGLVPVKQLGEELTLASNAIGERQIDRRFDGAYRRARLQKASATASDRRAERPQAAASQDRMLERGTVEPRSASDGKRCSREWPAARSGRYLRPGNCSPGAWLAMLSE